MGEWLRTCGTRVTALAFLCIVVGAGAIGRWSTEADKLRRSRRSYDFSELRHLEEPENSKDKSGKKEFTEGKKEEEFYAGHKKGESRKGAKKGESSQATQKGESEKAVVAQQSEEDTDEAAQDEKKKEKEGKEEKEGGEEEGEEKGEGEGEGEEKEEDGEEEEKEEEEFTPLDLTCAIWLLALVSFNMSLFYFVNWPDPEMKIYVWTVISTTISIFIAIFVFACVDLVLRRAFTTEDTSKLFHAALAFLQLSWWFLIMQVSVAWVSGSLDEHPFKKAYTNNLDASSEEEDVVPSIEDQKTERKILFSSIATLCAHITGFAAINAGGCLQHMHPFDLSAGARFAVPPIMFVGQLIVSRIVRLIRGRVSDRIKRTRFAGGDGYKALKTKDTPELTKGQEDSSTIIRDSLKGLAAQSAKFSDTQCGTDTDNPKRMKDLRNEWEKLKRQGDKALEQIENISATEADLLEWCMHSWDEETYDSEVDVAGLAVSFLLVQAVRFVITGVMPNNLGIEEPPLIHPMIDIYGLLGVGLGFAGLCVVFVIISEICLPKNIQKGTLMSTVKRIVLIGKCAFATSFAWCLFVSSKWEIARLLPEFNPNGVVSRVLLTCGVSAVVFCIILCLDKLADLDCTGDVADSAIIAIIGSFATLVGFSFEQSFDGAVEALADLCFADYEVQAEIVLALSVCLIVYPAWKKHILRTLITLRKEHGDNDETEQGTGTSSAAIEHLSVA